LVSGPAFQVGHAGRAGRPLRSGEEQGRALVAAPGVWCVGLRWLIRRRSSLLFGFPDDAATVADAVRAHLSA
jgi:putative flavoprotein involved in K+ transport